MKVNEGAYVAPATTKPRSLQLKREVTVTSLLDQVQVSTQARAVEPQLTATALRLQEDMQYLSHLERLQQDARNVASDALASVFEQAHSLPRIMTDSDAHFFSSLSEEISRLQEKVKEDREKVARSLIAAENKDAATSFAPHQLAESVKQSLHQNAVEQPVQNTPSVQMITRLIG